MGASVRGAIDLVRLGRELSALRGEGEPGPGDATFADAAIAALSGRLRLDEGCEQTPEAIVLELIERLKPVETAEAEAPGKANAPPRRAGRAAP
jgi:MoxR-like ATPase